LDFALRITFAEEFFASYRQCYYEGSRVKYLRRCVPRIKPLDCILPSYSTRNETSTKIIGPSWQRDINLVMAAVAEERETNFPRGRWPEKRINGPPNPFRNNPRRYRTIVPFRGCGSATLWFMPPLSCTNGTTIADQSLINHRRRFSLFPLTHTHTFIYVERTMLRITQTVAIRYRA